MTKRQRHSKRNQGNSGKEQIHMKDKTEHKDPPRGEDKALPLGDMEDPAHRQDNRATHASLDLGALFTSPKTYTPEVQLQDLTPHNILQSSEQH